MSEKSHPSHSLWLSIVHGMQSLSALLLMSSGWTIYRASPLYHFEFPNWLRIGEDLTDALRWHFFSMWFFFATSVLFVVFRLIFPRGGPALRPFSAKGLYLTSKLVLVAKLPYQRGSYNEIQRCLYTLVLILNVLIIGSGLALWKPVQLNILTEFFGGYEMTRYVHFWAMSSLLGFVGLHVVMIIVHPSTLLSMFFGSKIMDRT